MKILLLLTIAYLFAGCQKQPARPFAITTVEAIESRPETPRESSKEAEKPSTDVAGRDLEILSYACKIKGSRSSGVNTPYGVLTCWHCVKDAYLAGKPIEVIQDDETVRATVTAFDEQNDLAILAVKWVKVHSVAIIDTDPIVTDQRLFSAGRLRDGKLVDQYRVVESQRAGANSIYTDNPFVGGQSGSGLFNANGRLVGIIKAVDMTDEPYRGWSTSAAAICRFTESIGVKAAKPTSNPPLSVVIYIKAHCKPGDAACERCKQQVDLVGDGDKRIKVTISTDPIPLHIKIPNGYLYPVVAWETKDRWFWPKNSGVYSLDQIVEMVERTSK